MSRWLALALVCCAAPLAAQAPITDTSPFRPLDLPAPNAVRTGSGRPGAGYWQQRVDYRIQATLDPAANEVRGTGTITYHNNSPDTLPFLWLFVEQNLCAPTSVTNQLNQPPLKFLGAEFDFSCQGFPGGLTLEYLRADGTNLQPAVSGTTLRADLPRPLPPGGQVSLEASWRFKVPALGGGRMGHDGPLYEIAQWYPRLVVYDDIRGWNHEPYIGAGEFYLEYGSFDVSLTVPAGYIVAATGQLQNPEAVLTPTQRARLARARTSDTVIAIITKDEALATRAPVNPSTRLPATWHFTADSVRDFAFAAAPGVRWDASGWKGILIDAIYRPSAAPGWEEVGKMGREAIRYFSEQWYQYPYSHATTFEGPIEGMEYPMLTFTPHSPSREDQQWVIAHEFGHQWYPMIVGSNERLYPWMDEGFNTFIDLENSARYFRGTPYGDTVEVHPLHLYPDHATPGEEQPLITNPTQVRDLFWVGYQKPALMLHLLRREVLGTDRFDPAFRDYTRTWAFKHPAPPDFFRMMRNASGMDLDWFWRGWIYTTARLDQAVDSVTARPDGGSTVFLASRGTMIMPAELALAFADGSTDTVKLPIEMWNLGARFTYRVPGTRRVRRAEVDPRRALPDVDRTNDAWPR